MANLSSRLVLSLRDKVSGPARRINGTMNRMNNMGRRFSGRNSMGSMFTGFAARAAGMVASIYAIRGAFRNTIGASMNFAESFAEVRKVVDGSPAALAHLRKGIIDLSKKMPTSAADLSAIMGEAGQAGISNDILLKFTEFAAKSGVAFDMQAREVGSIFAKLKNVFKLDMQGVIRVGDAANFLSNKMAAKASEILDFTNRAAGAAMILKLLPRQLSAVGAAMVASGIKSETAARGLNAFSANLVKGGPKIRSAFRMMGISFKAWKKLQGKDGPAAMVQLFKAMNKSPKGLKSLINLFGKDFSDDFIKLVKNPEILEKALNMVKDPVVIRGSVDAEFVNKMDTPLNKIRTMQNNLKAIGIELGDKLAKPIGDSALKIAKWLETLDSKSTVFDNMKQAWKGFMAGLDVEKANSMAQVTQKMLDAMTYKDHPGGANNNFSETFNSFKQFGKDLQTIVGGLRSMFEWLDKISKFGRADTTGWNERSTLGGLIRYSTRPGSYFDGLYADTQEKNKRQARARGGYTSPAEVARDEASGHHRTNGGQPTLERLKEIIRQKNEAASPVSGSLNIDTTEAERNLERTQAKIEQLKASLRGLNSSTSSLSTPMRNAFSDGTQ